MLSCGPCDSFSLSLPRTGMKMEELTSFLASAFTVFEAGETGDTDRPLTIGMRRFPGVITMGLPLRSSAYLKPTATARGLFRRPGGNGG